MNQNQNFPFERNRYYAGKLLTSADFQAEQDYFTGKSRFLNSLMYGCGILCGLGTFSLDDLSILVESGVAIDSAGREIILDTSIVRKLSAIEGYNSLTSDDAILGIRYVDEPMHSVYAVSQNAEGGNYEFGRVAEKFQLFLMNAEEVSDEYDIENEFFTGDVLYQDSFYKVELVIPSIVTRNHLVKAQIKVTALTGVGKKLDFHGILQIPGLTSSDNEQEVAIDLEDIILDEGEVFVKDYWLTANDGDMEDTMILLKSGSGYGFLNEEPIKVPSGFAVKLLFSDMQPRELVNKEIGKVSLEIYSMASMLDFIPLAKIHLLRTVGSYVIVGVDESVKRYLSLPSQEIARGNYLDYFFPVGNINDTEVPQVVVDNKAVASVETTGPEIATGVLEIPLGNSPRKGGVYYSGEIMHGLGKGNVYVQIGYESITSDMSLGSNVKSTIYGNADLFKNDHLNVPAVETAVKVLNDKGSFVVAAQLQENVDFLILTYRWVAVKFPSGNEIDVEEDYTGKSIVPETPTVVLATKDSHYFGVRYQNMESCSITYELTEEGSGEITSDGIYTAPNKEGVYEIRIYCTDMPVICTYAYAIVKKQSIEDLEMENREMQQEADAESAVQLDVKSILK